MQEKKQNNSLSKMQKLIEEEEIIKRNNEDLANQNQRKQNERDDLKNFWQHQLANNKNVRQQEKEAADVYKRQDGD